MHCLLALTLPAWYSCSTRQRAAFNSNSGLQLKGFCAYADPLPAPFAPQGERVLKRVTAEAKPGQSRSTLPRLRQRRDRDFPCAGGCCHHSEPHPGQKQETAPNALHATKLPAWCPADPYDPPPPNQAHRHTPPHPPQPARQISNVFSPGANGFLAKLNIFSVFIYQPEN